MHLLDTPCVNEVLLLHARDGYWAHSGSAGAANDQPSAERRCQPIQTTLKMQITLADSLTWDDKIPTTETEHRLAEGRVTTRRQHNHLPRHVGKVRSSFDQRIMSILR